MIVSYWGSSRAWIFKIFQFHYGMIVSWERKAEFINLSNFNSTMGWLWDFTPTGGAILRKISIPLWDDCEPCKAKSIDEIIRFQFHYGMIVRFNLIFPELIAIYFNSTMGWLWGKKRRWESMKMSNFNSTMGWLWVGRKGGEKVWKWVISIPLWDDCELTICCANTLISLFQFHYGMIVR